MAPRDAVAATCCRGCTAPSPSPSCSAPMPDLLIGARLGAPLTVGYGEGENYLGSDAHRAGAAHPAHRLSRRRRLGGGEPRARSRSSTATTIRVERAIVTVGASGRADRQGQSPPLHAQGDLRAAGRRGADAALVHPPARAAGRAARHGFRPGDDRARRHRRLRHRLLCRHDRQILDRALRARCRSKSMSPPSSATAIRSCCPNTLGVVVTQSGETADTLAALRAHEGARASPPPGIINVPTSSMAREVDLLLPTHAGPEIGVASTKAFTCQLAVMAALAVNLARAKGKLRRGGGARDRPPPDRGARRDQRRARA